MSQHEPGSRANELTLVRLYALLLKRRRLLVWMPFLTFCLVVGVGLARPRTYTSYASFVPAGSSSSLSRLNSLAAQFGVPLAGGALGGTVSPDFYASLLRSRELLRAVVDKEYRFEWRGDSLHGNLVDLLKVPGHSPEERRERAVKRLGAIMDVTTSLKTGIVSLAVRTRYGPLSLQLAEEALRQLNAFNLQARQQQASAERQFMEDRLADAQRELRSAEDRMQEFLQQNREYRASPSLTFTQARLQRTIDVQQQVVLSIAQGYEQSRMEEVRNTPVITTVEEPILPPRPDSRLLLLKGLLAILVGVILAIGYALIAAEYRRMEGDEPDDAEEVRVLWSEFLGELRHPGRLLLPRRSASG